MGSRIHYGFLDSQQVPGFTMGSWYCARHGTEMFSTARIIRARNGNIWHGTDHKGTARKYLARHGSTRSWHGTARGVPERGRKRKRERNIRRADTDKQTDKVRDRGNKEFDSATYRTHIKRPSTTNSERLRRIQTKLHLYIMPQKSGVARTTGSLRFGFRQLKQPQQSL